MRIAGSTTIAVTAIAVSMLLPGTALATPLGSAAALSGAAGTMESVAQVACWVNRWGRLVCAGPPVVYAPRPIFRPYGFYGPRRYWGPRRW